MSKKGGGKNNRLVDEEGAKLKSVRVGGGKN